MANREDTKDPIGSLTDVSRNKRQASVLLSEVARERSETATRKCAQSEKIMKDCQETCDKAKKLRDRRAG